MDFLGHKVFRRSGSKFYDHQRYHFSRVRFLGFPLPSGRLGGWGAMGNPRALASRIHDGLPQVGCGAAFGVIYRL